MRILGIEASAKIAGACVYEEKDGKGTVVSEMMTGNTLTHSETLMPMIDQTLRNAGLTLADIDYLAFTKGPGSFTGLRIGAATVKGLSLGRVRRQEDGSLKSDLPIVPVGTLESLAAGVGTLLHDNALRVPVMDARRNQVYTAVYREKECLMDMAALSVEELCERLKKLPAEEAAPIVFTGDAAHIYADYFKSVFPEQALISPAPFCFTRASVTATLAARKIREYEAGRAGCPYVFGDELEVQYLRKSQAEREHPELAAMKTKDVMLAGEALPEVKPEGE